MADQDLEIRRARDLERLPPAHRRAPRPGVVPEMREAAARARAQPVRALRREETSRRPHTPPPARRRAYHPGPVPEVREAAARARCQPVRALRRSSPCRRTRPLRDGQGGRQALWRTRPRATPKAGSREEPAALARTPRSGPVHPLRAPATGRGRNDLRAMPRIPPGGRARPLCRAACSWRVRQMRCARPRRQRALRTVRQERGQTLKEEGEERPRPPALRPAPGARALHRLRRTGPGRGPVPGVRPPLVPALGRASRSADPVASLHGHRDRDGR